MPTPKQLLLAKPCLALLLLTGLLLPFAIAASNILLGSLLAVSMLTGAWMQGARSMWQGYPLLTTSLLLYLALMPVGLLWSNDLSWGIHVVSKYWSWLLLPAIVGTLSTAHKQAPAWMLTTVSIGLTLHLFLCVIQWMGLLPGFNAYVSTSDDATGMIGRIGFGLIYGMWSAWLLHTAIRRKGWQRYLGVALVLLSVIMVFLAKGRSGYLVVLILALVIGRKLFGYGIPALRFWGTALCAMLLASVLLWQSETLRHRIQWTISSLEQAQQGDLAHSEPRLSIWYGALLGWKEHPWIGVGTGGFPKLSRQVSQKYGLTYEGKPFATHTHQIYLLALVRWGPVGLLITMVWLGSWIAAGWRGMEVSPYRTLIVASGLALATHGLTSPSLEDYYSSVYGVLLLSIGLAGRIIEADEQEADTA